MRFEISGRRALLAVALIALLWALALRITGGFAVETGWRLISSRNAVRPLWAGLTLATLYFALWRRHWREDLGPFAAPAAWPPVIAGISAAVALVVGLGWGTRIGAGPDQSGYVSEAAMFARGELTLPAPEWSRDAPWDDAAYTASPVGWHPTHQTHRLGPVYSPGLPLVMALFQTAAGEDAVFAVVPLLGALLVWATYLVGAAIAGPWAGAMAAALLVSSPTFLFMQQQVMSDVPVAAFWTLSLAAALLGAHPAVAGLAAGAAVLTRPNLVPLVVVPFVLLLLRERRAARLAAFAAPIAAAAAIVGALNWTYSGSPLISGYGALSQYYSLDHVRPNLLRYGRWFFMLHTPVVLVGLLAAVVATGERTCRWRVALVTLSFPIAMMLIYMPFLVFHENDWGYTRFLLPAYPELLAGVGTVAAAIAARARARTPATVAVAAVVAALAIYGWTYSVTNGVFLQRTGDARFARAVEYALDLPARSVLVSNAHSGTLRHYTGRDVLRFETLPPSELDIAVDFVRRQGYRLFLIGDEFEIAQFRTRFVGTRTAARLGPKPRAAFDGVAVYDLP